LDRGRGDPAALGLQTRVCFENGGRIALGRSAIVRLGQDAVAGGCHQLAAEIVHRGSGRPVLCGGFFSAGQKLGGGDDAVGPLKLNQALFLATHALLQIGQLPRQPVRIAHGGLNLRQPLALPIGANQLIDHCRRQHCVARSEANFDEQGSGNGAYLQSLSKALQQPGLRAGRGGSGIEVGQPRGDRSPEAGVVIEFQAGDDQPGEIVAAQHAGCGLLRHRRGEGREGCGCWGESQIERRLGSGAKLHPRPGLVFPGGEQTVERTKQEQAAFNPCQQPALPVEQCA